jgi:hypothetical protein
MSTLEAAGGAESNAFGKARLDQLLPSTSMTILNRLVGSLHPDCPVSRDVTQVKVLVGTEKLRLKHLCAPGRSMQRRPNLC